MLPWEHVAVAYVAYSLSVRVLFGRPPTARETVVVVFASLLPDLIDKPLAWELHLVNGKSVGHSLFFALSATVLAWLAGGRRVAAALAVGLLTHAVTDAAFQYALRGYADWTFVLWPLVDRPAVETPGLVGTARLVFDVYVDFLTSTEGQRYLVFEVLLLGGATALWLIDGRPGTGAYGARGGDDADALERF